MVASILNSLLCYCCYGEVDDIYDEHDAESSQLIPDDFDYSDPTLVDQERIRKRLGTIVRAKEGKMVNIGSHIPFNLHNQVLPSEVNHNHSLSRSISGSFDFYDHPPDDHHGRPMQYQQQSYLHYPYSRSLDLYGDISSLSRPGSPERGAKPNPNPILNVRLVSFMDERGRTKQRRPEFDSEPGSGRTVTISSIHSSSKLQTDNVSSGPETWPALGLADKLKSQEVGAISLSWGD